MSAYRKRWFQILKESKIPDWEVDIHGQAIVVKVPVNDDADAFRKHAIQIIDGLSREVSLPGEWLKFIFYNEKMRVEYILNSGPKA